MKATTRHAARPKRHRRLSSLMLILLMLSLVVGITSTSLFAGTTTDRQTASRGSSKIIVAAIGDSNTWGLGVPSREQDTFSYPGQLQQLLGDSYRVINYGISGRTLLDSGDYPYRNEAFYKDSQAVQPNIVLIMLGTNDSKYYNWKPEAFEIQLEQFIRTYKNLPSRPDVYVLSVPAAYDNNVAISPSVIREQIVPMTKRAARDTQAYFIDIYSVTQNRSDLFPDGVHPNKEGYGVIADTVYKSITVRR